MARALTELAYDDEDETHEQIMPAPVIHLQFLVHVNFSSLQETHRRFRKCSSSSCRRGADTMRFLRWHHDIALKSFDVTEGRESDGLGLALQTMNMKLCNV